MMMSSKSVAAILTLTAGISIAATFVWLHAPQRALESAIASSSDVHAEMFDRHRPLAVDDEQLTVVQPPAPADAAYQPGPADPYGAAETITLDDDRQELGAARWQQPTVTYNVVGDAATPQAVRDIDATYRWLSDATGVTFQPVDPDRSADITVAVNVGAAPRAIIISDRRNGTIHRAVATWDPTHSHASRWHYEELGHTVGPLGDYAAPLDSVYHNSDQTAAAFTAHDAWLLRTLYAADHTPNNLADALDLYRASVH